MHNDLELSPYFSMRIDPKIRFGLELAARITKRSFTNLIESALMESFKDISFDPLGELDHDDPERVHYRLSDKIDFWFDEHPLTRMQLMSVSHAHLMSSDDQTVLAYIFTRPDLFANGKLNRRVIVENWKTIKADALSKAGAR